MPYSLKFWVLLLSVLLAACSDDAAGPVADDSTPVVARSLEGVQRFYAEHPEVFSFRSLQDLPGDLDWLDGSDQPEIGSAAAKKGGTFYAAMADFPRTLRWYGPDANSHFRSYMLDDLGLFIGRVHPQTRLVYPGLAREWAVSRERRTVYVRLHPEARWSDGEPVSSDDFLYMFYFMRSPHIRSPWMNNFYTALFTNITRYDDLTFSITSRAAKPDFVEWVMEMSPIAGHFFGELTEDFVENFQWQPWPSTGPYQIRETDVRKGRSITLTRNEDWWARDRKFYRNRFNPDRIRVSVIRDRAKTIEVFRHGEIDQLAIDSSSDWYEKLPDSDPLVSAGYVNKTQFHNQHPFTVRGLYMNSHRELLNNRDVRLGIQYSSNWQKVIGSLYRGDYRRLNTWNDGFGAFSHPTLEARRFDIEQARQHFAAAGFEQRGDDGVLRNSRGERLGFTLTFGDGDDEDLLTVLKQEALKAGLELRLEKLDRTAAWKKVQEKKHDIQYTGFAQFLEMYPRYWEGAHSKNSYDQAFLDDGSVNPARKLKPQTNNYEVIALTELDRLIEIYDRSDSAEEMIALAHRIDEILFDYAAFVPGAARDFYRLASWRWVRYPEGFNLKYSREANQHWVHWIDEDLKAETLAARKTGQTFPQQVKVFDQFRKP